jgi:hypothetical protein
MFNRSTTVHFSTTPTKSWGWTIYNITKEEVIMKTTKSVGYNFFEAFECGLELTLVSL